MPKITWDAATTDLVRSVLTWFLVIMGWMVVSDQQASRELAKNYYGRLQALRDDLKAIESAAVAFHTSKYDKLAMRKIARAISEFGIESSHLRKATSLPSNFSFLVARFRKAITSANFDSSSHSPQSLDCALVEDILLSKDLLDRVLLEAFQTVTAKQPTLLRSIISSLRRIF